MDTPLMLIGAFLLGVGCCATFIGGWIWSQTRPHNEDDPNQPKLPGM